MAIRKRSKSRERFLDEMFSARQYFKNKFNYYEAHPWAHRIYETTLLAYRITRWDWNSIRRFSRVWRKKMDGMFDLETICYKRELIIQMIREEEEKQSHEQRDYYENEVRPRPRSRRRRRSDSRKESQASIDPVARLLINYDREVVAMIREVKREFNHYLDYPHRYPYIHTEKKKFLREELQTADNDDEVMDIDVDFNNQAFKNYWQKRAGVLCDEKVKFEKSLLRSKWRFSVRNHLRLSRNPRIEDLRCLLESDNDEEDPDVEIIEDNQSIIYVSSDED